MSVIEGLVKSRDNSVLMLSLHLPFISLCNLYPTNPTFFRMLFLSCLEGKIGDKKYVCCKDRFPFIGSTLTTDINLLESCKQVHNNCFQHYSSAETVHVIEIKPP